MLENENEPNQKFVHLVCKLYNLQPYQIYNEEEE